MKENRRRIVVDVQQEFHTDIKLMAFKLGVTIKKYALDALGRALAEDKERSCKNGL